MIGYYLIWKEIECRCGVGKASSHTIHHESTPRNEDLSNQLKGGVMTSDRIEKQGVDIENFK